MSGAQRKNIILGLVLVVLVAGAVYAYFGDSLFGPSESGPAALDPSVVDEVIQAGGGQPGQAEPNNPNPPPRGSGKLRGNP